ncbi:hypothetical protein DSM25558_0163 [Agrobacterium sp. DSM 25558]|uniref:hypothetical protein n=1 Tax=Agrobacterium sp. DSM 25558 TaxID=1907665 RepID=UPI0009725144|nr:hypothetical protein [Agrobacterium sp. DSM 25558]SCX00700.1 hypothetical protein DSM25558_0163 [Agrobacterium sp. DSM 25558]
MTKRALVKQAELKRMAAIAKSEGVVVSIEVDGRKFSVSPFIPESTHAGTPSQGPNSLDEWQAQRKARFGGDDSSAANIPKLKDNRRKVIDVDKVLNDWNAYLGYDPRTMNGDDYKRLFAAKEQKRRKEIPSLPMTKLERSALRQLLAYGVGVSVNSSLIKPCGPETEERLEARGFIEFQMHEKFPDQVQAYVLTEAGHATAVKLLDQS